MARTFLTRIMPAALGAWISVALGTAAAADDPTIEANPVTHADFNAVVFGGGGGGGGAAPPEGTPASFSLLPTYVTDIRNQGSCGSCWAFATYGAIESTVLMEGGPALDLSENHLKNEHGFDLAPCAGGHVWMSWAYLSRLDGPVAEADDPYHAYDDRPSPGGPRQGFLREGILHTTPETIKNAVMTTGAVMTSMHWSTSSYNSSEHTYLYTGGSSSNHAVGIVGWDDAKPVSGATNSGAWQVRNSWGSGWGDGGYFWISYEDTRAADYGAAMDLDPASVVGDAVYEHDEHGSVVTVNTPYAMNAFTAARDEILKAVSFYTMEDGTDYDLRIYDEFADGTLSGLLSSLTGEADYGYHAVDLETLLDIDAGDDFYVYLHLAEGGDFPHSIDRAETGYSSDATASADESFYSFDGSSWTDLTTWDLTANFSIKAYTVPEPATLALFVAAALAAIRRRRH